MPKSREILCLVVSKKMLDNAAASQSLIVLFVNDNRIECSQVLDVTALIGIVFGDKHQSFMRLGHPIHCV